MSNSNKKLLDIDAALQMEREDIRHYYRRYINSGLVDMMSLMDFDKQFVKAQGEKVWDAEGREYLDFLGGYGALNLGHNPPVVQKAVEQVGERPNILQASLNPLAAAFAYNLAQVTPGDLEKVFFGNSGTEAVEGALKLARAANPGRSKILYCKNSFHGKSFGSLSVTGREKYRQPFLPLLPDCNAVEFGNLEDLEMKLSRNDVAAFIVEPIQGEGGVIVPPEGYLAEVRQLCDRYKAILIVDEIQTGFGRTGRLFACEHEEVVPDIMCLAKSLGGGVMPIGAYIARPHIWNRAYKGIDKYALHTSTFGGNSLAMAAGIVALQQIITEKLTEQAEEKGNYFLAILQQLQDEYDIIKEVRGKGLLIGMEFNQPATGVLNKLTGGKLNKLAVEYFGSLVASELLDKYQIITAYTLNNPNVIRLEPPLIVTQVSLDKATLAVEEILRDQGFKGVVFNSIRTAISNVSLHR